ncbi:hypothetical protein GQ457_02G000030 [Hibiscus cannabinus]
MLRIIRIPLGKKQTERIVNAFESFENDNHATAVQTLTAVSPYASMHEDVNNFALDKYANIILIPFHKRPDTAGGWTDEKLEHKLNHKKGIRECRVAMLFVGGPDDREALAYAWRMAGTPHLILTLVRFVPGKDVSELIENVEEEEEAEIFTVMFEREKQKQLDDDYINEFRFKTMHDQSIAYIEEQVNGGDQIVSAINSAYNDFDLYVVGRGYGRASTLTAGLSNWSDSPELGPLGGDISITRS